MEEDTGNEASGAREDVITSYTAQSCCADLRGVSTIKEIIAHFEQLLDLRNWTEMYLYGVMLAAPKLQCSETLSVQ